MSKTLRQKSCIVVMVVLRVKRHHKLRDSFLKLFPLNCRWTVCTTYSTSRTVGEPAAKTISFTGFGVDPNWYCNRSSRKLSGSRTNYRWMHAPNDEQSMKAMLSSRRFHIDFILSFTDELCRCRIRQDNLSQLVILRMNRFVLLSTGETRYIQYKHPHQFHWPKP